LINQILDILEVESPELYVKTVEKINDNNHMINLISALDDHIDELDDFDRDQMLELLTNIVGDA